MRYTVILSFILIAVHVTAQEDLLSLIDVKESNYISYTFKGNKIVNGESVEAPSAGVLQFQIQHRFGTLNSGFYNLYGLDNAQIRLGLDYGLKDWLCIGIGRSSALKTIDVSSKLKIMRQKNGMNAFPFTIAYYTSVFQKQFTKIEKKQANYKFSDQLSYVNQLLIAHKINRKLSLQISPTIVHYNLVGYDESNDRLSIGFSSRYKISNRVSINTEYFLQAVERTNNDVLSFGFDIETGGHIFQLHLSNSPAMIAPAFIHETKGIWAKGDIYFGFNISRVFSINENR
ncbi:MAG: hypothetical protein CBC83_06650 [Flavobacteriales bacterium TMED123]|nr:MAG: hypothetical protein CBC83_06650 [Flavobacteriales bacterium TMED123]|tara:strand:+ start:1127 stop:1987 length:861 start_codon:yes stop_codon:yes gene_type:complete